MHPAAVRRVAAGARRKVRRLLRRLSRPSVGVDRPSRRSLNQIGLETGTDKSSAVHDYLEVYDATFAQLRDKKIQVVEIGVHQGASLRMWEEYFSRARLYGIDISERCLEHSTERATVLIGDQSQAKMRNRLARRLRPTVVIDDGSHVWRHQIATLRTLFPVVRPGGFFVVEDIHTSFGDDYAKVYGRDGSTETAYSYVQRIAEVVTAGSRAKPVADDFVEYCRQTVASVLLFPNSAILRKRDYPQRKYRVRSIGDLVENAHIRDLGGTYPRIPAELVDASQAVRDAFDQLHGNGTVEVAPAASAEVVDARVVGSGQVTVGNTIIDETLNCARNVRRNSGLYQVVRGDVWVDEMPYRIDHEVSAVPGRRHVLLKQTWDANYGHWTIDTLPKVGLLREFTDLSHCTFVLNQQGSSAMRGVVEDSLSLFGISKDQLMFLDKSSYRFERLTVLGSLTRHPVSKSPYAIEILEELRHQVPMLEASERLYVTRRGAARRRLANEDAIIERLKAHGYTVIAPEELRFADQVAAFRNARHVVGVMGAALSNLAFAPRGVSVLSLATPAMKHDYFYDLVCLKQGRYRGIQGVAARCETEHTLATDFTIDVARLDEALEWLHSEQQ